MGAIVKNTRRETTSRSPGTTLYFFIITGILLSSLAGCAFGTRHVNLTYGSTLPPVGSRTPIYSAVAVAQLEDARSGDKSGTGRLLGKVRNGYGMPTASVVANQDPALWVTEAIARTLASQGFTVRRVMFPSDAGNLPVVAGALNGASTRMYASMDANVSASVNVQHNGSTVARLACAGQGSKMAWTVSSDEYRQIFEAAIADFAANCGPQLTRILTEGSE